MVKRIQRKRVKGWKKPPNTVIVSRPSKWGNPFILEDGKIYIQTKGKKAFLCNGDAEKAVRLFESIMVNRLLEGEYGIAIQDIVTIALLSSKYTKLPLHELKGKNLACFCPEGQPCHADVLIKLANK